MPKFLIEVPHEAEEVACIRAAKVLLESGSHFLTNAEFGCFDGVHKAWIIVDMATRDDARNIIPVAYRSHAEVISLNKFSLEQLEELLEKHSS